jgi:anhydro-N-acetylmuramic acid kinase
MPRTIGLMSGTSLDGVDAAWLDTDGISIAGFGPAVTLPYDPALRAELRAILDLAPALPPYDPRLAGVVERLTDHHVRAVEMLGCAADLVGFHGQTILHQPDRRRTWQIGDAPALARRLGVKVAYDFRSADVAAGGQGAPLAPLYHAALAADLRKPLAVLNIGGVANVTWIGRDGAMLAFDTGPGNGPLDDWVWRQTGRPFDAGGALARSGQVDTAVLRRLLAHPYFGLPAPKSLDRLDFGRCLAESGLYGRARAGGASGLSSADGALGLSSADGALGLSSADGAATLAAFTVAAVAAAAFPEPPRRWLLCGGGRLNPVLVDGLRDALGVPVEAVEAVGWNGDALEAQCFGFLAARVLAGLPLSDPSTTGVPRPMPGGRIAQPG